MKHKSSRGTNKSQFGSSRRRKAKNESKAKKSHKAGAKSDISNCRPISLISNVAKIFEKIMYNRLYSFLKDCNQGRQVGHGGYGDSTPSEAMGIEFHRQQCQKT